MTNKYDAGGLFPIFKTFYNDRYYSITYYLGFVEIQLRS